MTSNLLTRLAFNELTIRISSPAISSCIWMRNATNSSSSLELRNNQDTYPTENQDALNPFETVKASHKTYLDELRLPQKRSFNLASYINQSGALREIFKLGVSLYDIERTKIDVAERYKHLDFERDCLPKVQFLVDNGLKSTNLGRFITEYPEIFFEDLENLQIRLNFLLHKGFTKVLLVKALNRSAHIISHPTKYTDYKLGLLQVELDLSDRTVISTISRQPAIIGIPGSCYKFANFTLRVEFGFKTNEVEKIIESQPKVLELINQTLSRRLDFVHNTVGLSHRTIAEFPKLLTGPAIEIENRFKYLKKLNRNQFNPREPLYVPPNALYSISDEDFCLRYAKTSIDDYLLFIKNS